MFHRTAVWTVLQRFFFLGLRFGFVHTLFVTGKTLSLDCSLCTVFLFVSSLWLAWAQFDWRVRKDKAKSLFLSPLFFSITFQRSFISLVTNIHSLCSIYLVQLLFTFFFVFFFSLNERMRVNKFKYKVKFSSFAPTTSTLNYVCWLTLETEICI